MALTCVSLDMATGGALTATRESSGEMLGAATLPAAGVASSECVTADTSAIMVSALCAMVSVEPGAADGDALAGRCGVHGTCLPSSATASAVRSMA